MTSIEQQIMARNDGLRYDYALIQPLSDAQIDTLESVIYDAYNDPKHPDDFFNLGGAWAQWDDCDESEREKLISTLMEKLVNDAFAPKVA